MSGPIAATYTLSSVLAAAAIEVVAAGAELVRGYADESERRDEQRAQRKTESEERRQMTLAARRALGEEVARAESQLRRLATARDLLAAQAGEAIATTAAPTPPANDSVAALADYLEGVRAQIAALNAEVGQLATHAQAVPAAELAALVAAAPNLTERLAAFEAEARLARRVPADIAAERRSQLERILARATASAGSPLPEDIEALADELMSTLSAERAEALLTELRLRIDRHNEAAATAAAALVLEQSLRDLGYEVDGIGETLFVEGGVAHFRKADWHDYFVRLRVDPARGAVNFNVVRPGKAGDDRRHEDMLAEERWCAEFPRLQETLAARGLNLAVTRMLAAGEVPVQVVDAASLPASGHDDERRVTSPRTMQRP